MNLWCTRCIRIGRIGNILDRHRVHRAAIIDHARAVRRTVDDRIPQLDILWRHRLLHLVVCDVHRTVVDFLRRPALSDVEIERRRGNTYFARKRADGGVVERIVLRIIPREGDRPTKGDIFLPIGAVRIADNILIRHIGSKTRCIEADRMCSNIVCRKASIGNVTRGQCRDKGILDRPLAVIHARNIKVAARQLHLTRVNCDVDAAQVRPILIRPEDRLRSRIADTVCLVKVLRRGIDIVVNLVKIDRV